MRTQGIRPGTHRGARSVSVSTQEGSHRYLIHPKQPLTPFAVRSSLHTTASTGRRARPNSNYMAGSSLSKSASSTLTSTKQGLRSRLRSSNADRNEKPPYMAELWTRLRDSSCGVCLGVG